MSGDEANEWGGYWSSKSFKRFIIESSRNLYFARVFASIVKKSSKSKNGPVLEAGCGSGAILKVLPENILKIGGDISTPALKIAQNNCHHVVKCDIACLPFKEKYFELVFNQGVMEHFSPEEFDIILRELKRVSKKVLIIVPSSTSVFQLHNPFEDVGGTFISKRELYDRMKKHFKNVKVFYVLRSFMLSVAAVGED